MFKPKIEVFDSDSESEESGIPIHVRVNSIEQMMKEIRSSELCTEGNRRDNGTHCLIEEMNDITCSDQLGNDFSDSNIEFCHSYESVQHQHSAQLLQEIKRKSGMTNQAKDDKKPAIQLSKSLTDWNEDELD